MLNSEFKLVFSQDQKKTGTSHRKKSAAKGFTFKASTCPKKSKYSRDTLDGRNLAPNIYIYIYNLFIYMVTRLHIIIIIMHGIFTRLTGAEILSINSTSQYCLFVGVPAN